VVFQCLITVKFLSLSEMLIKLYMSAEVMFLVEVDQYIVEH